MRVRILTKTFCDEGAENSLTVSRWNSKIENGRTEGKMHIIDPLNEIPEVGGRKSSNKKEQQPAQKGEAKEESERQRKSAPKKDEVEEETLQKPKKVDQQPAAQKANAPAAKVVEEKPAQRKVG